MNRLIVSFLFFLLSLNVYAAVPTLTGQPTDISVTEDTQTVIDFSAFEFTDTDNDVLEITLTASNGTFESTASATVTVSGSTTNELVLKGLPTDLNDFFDLASILKYQGGSNVFGEDSASITIKANDDNGNTNVTLATINVDITGVNDAPNITSTAITTIDEDQEYSYKLEAADVDGDSIVWRIISGESIPSWLSLNLGVTSTTVAGNGTVGLINDTGDSATFTNIQGVVSDSAGNIYVSEYENNIIRKIDVDGNVTTYAGTGGQGSSNGNRTEASFNKPSGLAIDSLDNIYVADSGSSLIRKITSSGLVSTIAGSGNSGSTDANGLLASFNTPTGIAVDANGNIIVADTLNHKIRKIDTSLNVTTIAGTGSNGSSDANGVSASFYQPTDVAVDSLGNIYVADNGNNKIRKIDTSNNVTTFAGSGSVGSLDASGTSATFSSPYSISIDSANNLYVSDKGNNKIRKIDSSSTVTTFAGGTTSGFSDGTGITNILFDDPHGVFAYGGNSVYIADTKNRRVRKAVDESRLIGTPTNGNVGSHTVNLEVYDGTVSTSHIYTITVANTNDVPTDISLNNLSVNQSSGVNATVGVLSTSDVDSGETFTYSLVSGSGDTNNSLFNINTDNLRANQASTMQAGTYDIRIQTSDLANTTYQEAFQITVVDDVQPLVSSVTVPNDDTYILSNNLSFTVNANETINVTGTPRIAISIGGTTKYATYANGSGTSSLIFTYTIEAGLLDENGITLNSSIDLNSGTLKDSAGNDLVLDLQSVASTASVLVDSTAPTIVTLDPSLNATEVPLDKVLTLTLDENVKKGSGNLVIKEYTNDDVFETIAISSDNITISQKTVTINHQKEFELNTQYYIEIDSGAFEDSVGNDFAGISSKETWKFLSINNFPPQITTNSASDSASVNINENTTAVLTYSATDPDGNNLTYSISGQDSVFFDINASTGDLKFKVAPNFEKRDSYTVTVMVTDDHEFVPLSDSQNLTVNILNVNESPVITSTAVTGILEDSLYTYNLKATDEDGNHLYWSVKSGETLPSWLSLTTQKVSVFAGNVSSGDSDANGENASFFYPQGLFIDSSGNIYVADSFNNKIRKIDTNGNVTTVSANTTFSNPQDLSLDSNGNIYVADTSNNQIKKIDSSGNVEILASSITFNNPSGIVLDSNDNIYVADTSNNRIIKITSAGVASTFTGGGTSGSVAGYKDGISTKALFISPSSIVINSNGDLIVADKGNNRLRKVDSSGTVSTYAGSGSVGSTDAYGTSASFNAPISLSIDSNDNIYIADSGNNKIRKIDKALKVITLSNDDLNIPSGVIVNSDGIVYASDSANNRIRKIEEINSLSGTPSSGDIGTYAIKLVVSDESFNVDHEFNLSVGNVNDEPTITIDSSLTMDEDNSADLTFTYIDNDGDTVSATQKTAPSNGSISINGTTITYTPTANFNGSDSFILTLSDGSGYSVDKTISVTVNAIDDAPVLSGSLSNQSQDEDSSGLIIDLSGISTSDVDNSEAAVYSVSSSDTNIATVSIENGRLIVVPVKNATGDVTITLISTINGLSDSISFTYTLNSVNDAPYIKPISDLTLALDSSEVNSTLSFEIWDDQTLDNNSLSVTCLNTDSDSSSYVECTNLSLFSNFDVSLDSQTQVTISYTIPAGTAGKTLVSVVAKDSSNLEYKEIFDFNVESSYDSFCAETTRNSLNFDSIKSNNFSQDTITSDLDLISTISSICDATITWSSSDSDLINNSGEVTAKTYNDTLSLTATITKGNVSTTKAFLLTVLSSSLSDEDAISKVYFDDFRGNNNRKDQIFSNLELFDSIYSKSISWSSSNESVINPFSGFVTRTNSDQNITLTATIGSQTKSFSLTVLKNESTASESIAKDKELLSLVRILGDNLNSDNIVFNLNKPLPTQGENGTSITWESSNSEVISTDGDVTRSSSEDKYVKLTATLINEEEIETKEFLFTVKQNSIDTQTSNVSYKRFEAVNNDISLYTIEDNVSVKTSSSFDSTLSNDIETVVNNDSVKSILELSEKILNIYLNTNGTSQASLEVKDSNNNSNISSLNMQDTGANTAVDENGNVNTSLTTTNHKIELKLNSDGSVMHTIEDNSTNKKTMVSSSLEGSNITSDSSGNTKTASEIVSGDYLYKIIVNTNSSGQATNSIEKIDLSTGSKIEDDSLLDSSGSYPIGTSVEIKGIGTKHFIETKTTLENAITIK